MNRMTIADFEQGKRSPLRNNLVMIRQAFEQQGITFIDENGGATGTAGASQRSEAFAQSRVALGGHQADDAAKTKSPSAATRRRAR